VFCVTLNRPTRVSRRPRGLGILLLLVSLAACTHSQPPFLLQDISGLMPTLEFKLTNQDDRVVSATDFRGRVVLLYFGYTQCPDVCPTTLAMLEQALRMLGPEAAKVHVLFVSVDPQRDTPAVLKRYVSNFGPQFIGLSGDDTALNALTRRYRVAYYREKPDPQGYYAVDHSSAVFVFDENGAARLLAEAAAGPKTIATDLRRLITSDGYAQR
jgi:protein SCO1